MTETKTLSKAGHNIMCDEWMPSIKVSLSAEQFRQLPRNSDYRYDYLAGQAILTPNTRHYHAMLEFAELPSDCGEVLVNEVTLRNAGDANPAEVTALFSEVFRSIQPFGGLEDGPRAEASQVSLARTRSGGDGPWIEQASFVAEQRQQLVGAVFITLLPHGDPCDSDSYRWAAPPPDQCIPLRLGQPHLTWIFVAPWVADKGIGTYLLRAAVQELRKLGYSQLLSTFLRGNDSSMLWHWRNGFHLLAYPDSKRQLHKRRNRQK